ncbi:epidermal growth factor receptor kinase substrate 8-like protein 3 [Notolabrus celidotus]|uniref:epidermal growth factor receptor kinase substrate 8-like protein 3 n=1 Tax=Notolabrus celidotus TaxID=1203425 RepID=UPI00148FA385|nr:epidermal growth factor receptor kinase substrate 8-like protein 3 [Notolabrus celidotus]
MSRTDSPFGNDTSSYAGSIQSNGYSINDEVSSQISNLSMPSARSIYMQRKDYAESLNKMMEKFQYRVEHLFTCDLNGKELRNVADCVERLKLLDGMGRVWAQSMILEIRGAALFLTDTETKEELESMALSDIQELKAVPNSGAIPSLLTLSVQLGKKHTTTVFMFQCEDVRADLVQKDFEQAISHREDNSSIRSSNAESVARYAGVKNHKSTGPYETRPPVSSVPAPDYEEDDVPVSELDLSQEEEEDEEEEEAPTPQPTLIEEPMYTQRPYTDLERNVDILNHIVSDIEIFMGKIAAVVAKNSKKKKKKKGKGADGMPPAAEFEECLHKIKCGFNLVAELNGQIDKPSAPEFVHSFFSTLGFVVSHCPEELPQTIVAPLLTPTCIRLLSEEASAEEDQLWQSLGDAWNIPSTKWPEDDEDIPTYNLVFFDGWQPPEVSAESEPGTPVRRQESPEPAPSKAPAKWTPAPPPPQKARPVESKGPMRVLFDFISRNHRELSVRKGEIVELLDKSKQWWKIKNSRGEEGFVPNNVLESQDEQAKEISQENGGPPALTRRSKAAEVKAWLEDKGFSKITVRCLGMLSGSMLLGMTREELKQVCPEEGGRVFFQLQAVRSALAAGI